MNEKEVSEIRRSLSPERQTINAVLGCYVNGNGEIIARVRRSVGLMSEDEATKYLSLFKKTLSGAIDRNLLDIPFSTAQVSEAKEHGLLMRLRESELADEAAVGEFFTKITAAYESGDNYCILLALNHYDVPYRGKDGAKYEDAGEETFTFLTCAVCPVKATKAGLSYNPTEKCFCNDPGENALAAPDVGFLFPSFDDRKTNIYDTLFYTKSTEEPYEELTGALFGGKIRMPAAEQGRTFHTVLAETLGEDCSFEVARAVHAGVAARMEEHKESKDPEPLVISQREMREMLESCGVPAEKAEKFDEVYTENFGSGTDLVPKNIVSPKKFELKTPEVVVKVTPEGQGLVETRVIDGTKYILIRADAGVELNGLDVKIK